MSQPCPSSSTFSHQHKNYNHQPAATAPDTKTLEWHKQNFYSQREVWRMKAAIEASPPPAHVTRKLPAHILNKPLPVRRLMTDDRGTLRVVNVVAKPTHDTESLRVRLAALRDDDVAAVTPLPKASSLGSSICRKPLPGTNREQLSSSANTASGRSRPHARCSPSGATQAHVPGAGRKAKLRTNKSCPPSELGYSGMLDVPLSVYGFRSTLPTELQPSEPPLRWDNEPAPQIPSTVSHATPNLYEDVELAKFMTANKSYLQPFVEKMPIATTVVKGKLNEFVEG